MRVRLLTAIALALTLSACFSAKPIAQSPASPPPSTGISESIFPHKSEWKDPAVHGVYVKDVLDLNPVSCLGCHGITDTVSGGAPSCRSCHKQFPHTEPGVTLATHGDYVIKNTKAACATQCHGTDLKGGISGVSCNKCHDSYPHPGLPAPWATPSMHGPAAKGDLKLTNKCNLCHGDDWKGGKSKSSCIDCHKGSYPHPAGWASPEQHGAFASTKNGTDKCATQCHGVQLDGGLSGVSCKDGCHKVWPHPAAGWMAVHGQTARSLGLSSCTGCHKNDATGGKTGITCTKCHTSLPAHQDAGWDKAGHGNLVMKQPASLTDPKGCPLCHGADLTGGKKPTLPGLKPVKGCKDCHASYPTLHKTAAGVPAWNSYEGHGKWVLAQVDTTKIEGALNQVNTLITNCKLCHGTDLKGGATGKSCYSCHISFPHLDIPFSKHGTIASAEKTYAASCATKNCHGQKLEGSDFNGKKLIMACTGCHLKMPHQAEWTTTHGASANADPTTCITCHGNDFKGTGTADSCYKCHDNYPLHHRDAKGVPNPLWKPAIGGKEFHGEIVKKAPGATTKDKAKALKCTTCHDSVNPGNPTPSCYSCHPSFPHAAAPVTAGAIKYTFTDDAWNGLTGFKNSHGEYVTAQVKASAVPTTIPLKVQSECAKTCHGTDLKGGTSDISCYKCHTTYPHAADWKKNFDPADATPGGAHSTYVLGNTSASCLNGCHTIDQPGGNSGVACTSCHAAYPHMPKENVTWTDGHKNFINTLAVGNKTVTDVVQDQCKNCHSTSGEVGANGIVACGKCHDPEGVYPHDAGWQVPYETDPNVFGGTHAIYILNNAKLFKDKKIYETRCYTACHGKDGTGGFSGTACNKCHTSYPHPDVWAALDETKEYPPHALAVLDTKGTPDKNDDIFNAANFSECAKCHGDAAGFPNTYPLGSELKSIQVAYKLSVARCYLCHNYPHSKPYSSGKDYPWKSAGHYIAVMEWTNNLAEVEKGPFVQKACGDTAYYAGCHTTGPKIIKGFASPACAFCHQ